MNHKKIIGMKFKEVKLNTNYEKILLNYIISIETLELSEHSLHHRKYIAKIFLYYLQINNILIIQNIKREDIIDFLNQFENYSKFTIRDYLAMLKVFLKFLYFNNYLNEPYYLTLPKCRTPKQSKIPSV